jgi:hypothetical protein
MQQNVKEQVGKFPIRIGFLISFSLLFVSSGIGQSGSLTARSEIYVMEMDEPFEIEGYTNPCAGVTAKDCYAVQLMVPPELILNYYTDSTSSADESEGSSQYTIYQSGQFVSIPVPVSGAQIVMNHGPTGEELAIHSFPSAGPGEVVFYEVFANNPGTPFYLATGSSPRDDERTTSRAEERTAPLEERNVGYLVVKTDIETEVFVLGRYYSSNDTISVREGRYRVRLSNSLGEKARMTTIESGEYVVIEESFRPERSSAFLTNLVLPGSGLLRIKKERGYGYIAGFLLSGAMGFYQYREYSNVNEQLDQALNQYNQASSISEASSARQNVLGLADERDNHATYVTAALVTGAVIYAASFIDLMLSEVSVGNQNSDFRVSMSSPAGHNRIAPQLRFTVRF